MTDSAVPWTLVVPTNGESPWLGPLLSACSDATARIVVWTSTESLPDLPVLSECTIIDGSSKFNIQFWWNRGISAAPTDVCAVVNDDVEAPPGSLARLAAFLAPDTLAMLAGHRLTGWCYALDRSHGVLPDERFAWYFGDDYLLCEAQTRGKGAVRHTAPEIIHHKFRATDYAQLRADHAVYRELTSS